MDGQLAFEPESESKMSRSSTPRGARQRRHLPELGLGGAPPRPQRLRRTRARSATSTSKTESSKSSSARLLIPSASARCSCGMMMCATVNYARETSEPGKTLRLQAPRPDLARNVGVDASAVAFAPDLARPVPHLCQRFERPLDVPVRRAAVLLDVGDDRAGVVLRLVVVPAARAVGGAPRVRARVKRHRLC